MFRHTATSEYPFMMLYCTDGKSALSIAVQADLRSTSEASFFSSLLARAAGECAAMAKGSPTRIATYLHEALRNSDNGANPKWAFYAAALATSTEVQVCTAGTIRIELVQDGQVVARSRDHIIRDDPPATQMRITSTMATVATRSVGVGSGLPPETYVWPTRKDSRIIILSSEWHQHQSPLASLSAVERFAEHAEVLANTERGCICVLDIL